MRIKLVVAVSSIVLLSACGSAPSHDGTEQSTDNLAAAMDSNTPPPPQTSRGTAEAEKIDCAGRKPPPDSRNDVLGVTIGMGAQEAYERLACANTAFTVAFTGGGFELPPIPNAQAPRTFLSADAGTEKVSAYLVGLPGQEKVYAILHQVEFGEGQEPPVDVLYKSLAAKYGQQGVQHQGYPAPIFTIARSPTGALLGPDNADFNTCQSDPSSQSISVSEACGFTVNLQVQPKQTNPGLAKALYLSLMDQRGAMQAIEAYKATASAADARAKADELKRANDAVRAAGSDNHRVPTL